MRGADEACCVLGALWALPAVDGWSAVVVESAGAVVVAAGSADGPASVGVGCGGEVSGVDCVSRGLIGRHGCRLLCRRLLRAWLRRGCPVSWPSPLSTTGSLVLVAGCCSTGPLSSFPAVAGAGFCGTVGAWAGSASELPPGSKFGFCEGSVLAVCVTAAVPSCSESGSAASAAGAVVLSASTPAARAACARGEIGPPTASEPSQPLASADRTVGVKRQRAVSVGLAEVRAQRCHRCPSWRAVVVVIVSSMGR